MADKSAIEWTDATWNPIRARSLATGKVGWHCEHVTPGCEHCYAEGFNRRLGTGLDFKPGHRKDIEIFLDEEMLTQPLRWKKPRRIFVGSMTDLFADFVEVEWLDKIFAVMALSPQHTFQVLTKRAKRQRDYLNFPSARNRIVKLTSDGHESVTVATARAYHSKTKVGGHFAWPLPNVWLGVSAERQLEADERIPLLLDTPAAVRFISAEPLLGPIDFNALSDGPENLNALTGLRENPFGAIVSRRYASKLDLVIVGGESGPKARAMHPDWARSLRDQCQAAGTAFFFKQWGEWLPWSQFDGAAIEDDPEQTRFATCEWDDGRWNDVGRPMWCDMADGDVNDEECVARVGKAKAGRLLDGIEHSAMPGSAR